MSELKEVHLTYFMDKGIIIDASGKSYTHEQAQSMLGERYIMRVDGTIGHLYTEDELTEYRVDESDRQCILLALHKLALERPGWKWYIGTIEKKFGGQLDWPGPPQPKPTLDDFMEQARLCNADNDE